jgi:hypothetical protein
MKFLNTDDSSSSHKMAARGTGFHSQGSGSSKLLPTNFHGAAERDSLEHVPLTEVSSYFVSLCF